MNSGVGRRCSSDPALLWLWCRPTDTAPIGPLAWEPPCAAGAALEMEKRPKKKKKNIFGYFPQSKEKIEEMTYSKLSRDGMGRSWLKSTRSFKLKKRCLKKKKKKYSVLWPFPPQLNRCSRSWSFWVGIPQGDRLTPLISTSISRCAR